MACTDYDIVSEMLLDMELSVLASAASERATGA